MEQNETKTDDIPVALKPRSRKHDIIFGICILLCGIVIGFGATLGLIKYNRDIRHSLIPHHKRDAKGITEYISRDLDLTPEQKQQIQEILEQRMKDFKPVMRSQIDKTNEEISKVLTEEQKEKWKKILEEKKKKREGNSSGSHHHP